MTMATAAIHDIDAIDHADDIMAAWRRYSDDDDDIEVMATTTVKS